MMWNQNEKQKYLDTLSARKRDEARRFFAKSEEFESKLGIDIGDMDAKTLFDTIVACNPQTYITAFAIRRVVIDYIDWRNKLLGMRDNNAAEYFNPLEICALDDTVKNYKNFDEIYQRLLSIYRPTDGMTCFPIACLAWLGLSAAETAALTEDDIDYKTKLIFVEGKKPSEYIECKEKRVLEILRIYQNTTVGERTQNRTFYVDLIDVGRFLKPPRTKNSRKDSDPISAYRISRIIDREFNERYEKVHGKPSGFTYEGLRILGRINRLEELVEEYGSVRSIPIAKLYEYTQFSKTNWTVPMIEATLKAFQQIHQLSD